MTNPSFKLTILVDDNDIDLFVQKRLLELNHFASQILTYQSPVDALNFLRTTDEVPEVIFLDLNMPILDGYEFLDEMMQLPAEKLAKVQVIILTSSSSMADREKTMNYPVVVDFISKPLSQSNLQQLKSRYAGNGKLAAAAKGTNP